MRVLRGIALLVMLVCGPAIAQDAARRHCNQKAKTQMELNGCATEEAGRADAELNLVYKKLLAMVKDDAVATGKIKAAERAWIAYRDATLDATYPAEDKQAEYGSMYPMEAEDLLTQLTRRRLRELNGLVRQFSNSR